MSQFVNAAPPSGGITWADHKDALLLIEPLTFESQIQTSFGPADAVKANVYVIDGAGVGESYAETLVFPKLLASQLKGHIGTKVLGRLSQGTAKPGQSAPWLLNEATPEDIAKGEAFLAQNQPALASAKPPF